MTGPGLIARALLLLGGGFLLSIAGIIALAAMSLTIPDVLQTLAVGSMTAIGALLATGRNTAHADDHRAE